MLFLRVCKGGVGLKTKDTGNLRTELMQAEDLHAFLEENEENFKTEEFRQMLDRLFSKCGLSKAALAKASGMSEVYLHQVFSGRRKPSRNRLLSLCFGLGATLEETQSFLRRSACAELYPHNRRDAILIFALLHGENALAVNDRLFAEGEETLF